MVIDHISHASLYYGLSPQMELALRYLASTDLRALSPGRYDLEGGCYAMVQDYETAPQEQKRWEAHRKYIDVQFIASGAELVGYACIDPSTGSGCAAGCGAPEVKSVEGYDEAGDVEWFEGAGSLVAARAGMFVILFPHDAHMPGVAAGGSSKVRKVVVKVPVERQ